MALRVLTLYYLICIFNLGDADISIEDLSNHIKRQIYNIYNGIPLIDKDTKDVEVTSKNITYYLSTKDSMKFIKIDTANPTILNRTDVPFVFLFHGWTQNVSTEWYGLIKKSLLQRNTSFYVVGVDWSPYADQDYILAAYLCGPVGAIVGEFIVALVKNYSIPLTNFLLIGHSLGGQVMGFAAKKVQQSLHQTLPRLIALDPAGPLFEGRPKEERLNSTDGKVVQVVHSNGYGFGYGPECGTIDMYPNGGTNQPGCLKLLLTDIKNISSDVFCSHHRSWQYYSEALIHPDKFGALKCALPSFLCYGKKVNMGNLETTDNGKFYLKTRSDPPYYKDE